MHSKPCKIVKVQEASSIPPSLGILRASERNSHLRRCTGGHQNQLSHGYIIHQQGGLINLKLSIFPQKTPALYLKERRLLIDYKMIPD